MPRIQLTDRSLLTIGDEELMFRPDKTLLSEAIAAEKVTGLTWPQIVYGLINGSHIAIQAVVWIMRKRSNPKLRITEVEFSMDEYRRLDPDFMPDHWVLTDDEDGVEVDAEGNIIVPEAEDEPETAEDPKDSTSPQAD